MKTNNAQVQRWLNDQNFQNFLRQVHVDAYVGLKNGVKPVEIEEALLELGRVIVDSIELQPQTPKPKLDPFQVLLDSGEFVPFNGVCDTCFKLAGIVFEAVEDPNDGYRSYLETIQVRSEANLTFSRIPFAKVQVKNWSDGSFTGYALVDRGGHVWLKVGTDNTDDYYPCFTFSYDPKRK